MGKFDFLYQTAGATAGVSYLFGRGRNPAFAEKSQDAPQQGQEAANTKPRNENPRTTAAGFDPEALERGAKALREINSSAHAKKVFELMRKQEDTRQAEEGTRKAQYDAVRAEHETERQKVLVEEQKKLVQQQAQTKAQLARYEDELTRKRMQAEHEAQRSRNAEMVKMQEESAVRQEQTRRLTEEHIQAQRRQTEKERAEIERETIRVKALAEAEARAHEAKLSEDVNRRLLVERANHEKEKWLATVNSVFTQIGGGLQELLTDQNKLVVAVGGVVTIAAGVYTSREGARVLWGYVDRILGQPTLIRESSRGKYPWSSLFPRNRSLMTWAQKPVSAAADAAAAATGKKEAFGEVILHPDLSRRIRQLAFATSNTKKHFAPFRNMIFHGPPGTGKTMAAIQLAKNSGLDYAIMTGGDVAPLGPQAVTKIHQLMDWAEKKNGKGLLVFIDEADAFLCRRNNTHMSENVRSALNALLSRTGKQSRDFVLVLATNRPADLDAAVTDRIDEVIEFPLPGLEERESLVKLYLEKYILQPEKAPTTVREYIRRLLRPPQKKIEVEGITDELIREVAERTEGFSGREIAKLLASVQGAVYGTEGGVLTPEVFRDVVEYKVQEHQKRKEFSAGVHDEEGSGTVVASAGN